MYGMLMYGTFKSWRIDLRSAPPASGWRPNKTAVEEMCEKAEEALTMITTNDVVVVHLFDNVSYMARSEEGGDLPIRRYVTGQFHVEGDLVVASKERLYMFFKNALPLLRLLEAYKDVLLTPLPRYLLESCCNAEDHVQTAITRTSRLTSVLVSWPYEVTSKTFSLLTT
jgi:hypothetical protein